MSFAALIARNVMRQRVRTLLTVVGIAIGVTIVIALGSITSGLRASSAALATANEADFMVAQKGASDLSFSTLDDDDLRAVRQVEGVDEAWGVLLVVSKVRSQPFFFTFGIEPAALRGLGLDVTEGGLAKGPDDLVLGAQVAQTLGVSLGDTLVVERHPFTVVGIYRSDSQFEANGAYARLDTVQTVARKPGVLTVVYVRGEEGVSAEVLKDRVEAASDRLVTISDADEYGQVDQGIRVLDAANTAISLLAVALGAIGVMNTMIMSVFERTREIGILRAVGWKGSRVVRMVLGESLMLCLIAAVVGTALGLLATRAVTLVPAVSAFLEPRYPLEIFVRALAVAVGVALVGALYPAFRAVRLSPMEALRYE